MKIIKNIFSYIKLFYFKIRNINAHFIIPKVSSIGKRLDIIADSKSMIKIGEYFGARNDIVLSARSNASIIIGKNVFINNRCQIVAHEGIVIEDNVKIGPNVLIFDHDYDYKNNGLSEKKYLSSKIKIGKNCWIGAGCIILRGTVIGDNCIIGAGSILKGIYESNQIVVQKRVDEIRKYEVEK